MPNDFFYRTAFSLTFISLLTFSCKQQRRPLIDLPDRNFEANSIGTTGGTRVKSKNLSKRSRAARVAKSLKDAFRLYDDQKGFSLASSELEEICNQAAETILSMSESQIVNLLPPREAKPG